MPGGEASATGVGSTSSLRRGFARVARIGARVILNAAIAIALMTLVPLTLAAVRGSDLQRLLHTSGVNTDARVQAVRGLRAFGVAPDASITPLRAGLALNALQPSHYSSPGFPTINVVRPAAPWRTTPLAADLFPDARPRLYSGPSSAKILDAAARGFNARELAYLRTLATAPIWTDFDIVARAPTVDVLGGRFRTPFLRSAQPGDFPLLQYRDLKELAYAAVSRAAYYVAIGQPRAAEATLRSIVSFGFALVDNGPTGMDGLVGTVIVGIGRDALQRFYAIEHDPRAAAAALAPPPHQAMTSASTTAMPSDENMRRGLLGRVDDPALPLFDRLFAVRRISMLSCTNPRELLFGLRPDARTVLDRASHTVARFPSERSFIELETRPLAWPVSVPLSNPITNAAVSVASVAGIVLDNPRLAQCTAVLAGHW